MKLKFWGAPQGYLIWELSGFNTEQEMEDYVTENYGEDSQCPESSHPGSFSYK